MIPVSRILMSYSGSASEFWAVCVLCELTCNDILHFNRLQTAKTKNGTTTKTADFEFKTKTKL